MIRHFLILADAAHATRTAYGQLDGGALDRARWAACRVCGCYERARCEGDSDGGCTWVEPNLCSECVGRPAEIHEALAQLVKQTSRMEEILALANCVMDDDLSPDFMVLDNKFFEQVDVVRRATLHAQQLLDVTRWPVDFDVKDPTDG